MSLGSLWTLFDFRSGWRCVNHGDEKAQRIAKSIPFFPAFTEIVEKSVSLFLFDRLKDPLFITVYHFLRIQSFQHELGRGDALLGRMLAPAQDRISLFQQALDPAKLFQALAGRSLDRN